MGHEGEGHVPVTARHSQCQRGVETVGELLSRSGIAGVVFYCLAIVIFHSVV